MGDEEEMGLEGNENDNTRIRVKRRKMIENETWADNGIGVEGAKAISESLKTNTTLTSLNLGGDNNEVKENDRGENKSEMRRMKEKWW